MPHFDGLQRKNSLTRFYEDTIDSRREETVGARSPLDPRQIKGSVVEEEVGNFLRRAAGIIESTQDPHATLVNNTDTTITGMTNVQQSWGLEVDASGSYIEIKGVAYQSLFLCSFTVDLEATTGIGDREIRWQFYDSVATTWGNTYYTRRTRRGADVTTAKETYTDTWIYNHINPNLTRVRVQIKQTSGGPLDISIPILRVVRIL